MLKKKDFKKQKYCVHKKTTKKAYNLLQIQHNCILVEVDQVEIEKEMKKV